MIYIYSQAIYIYISAPYIYKYIYTFISTLLFWTMAIIRENGWLQTT